MFKKSIYIIVTAAFISLLISCNSNTVYNQSVELPAFGWISKNAIAFEVVVADSLNNYEFGIVIRNTTTYRYSNIYFFLLTEFPNGNVSRDTIECMIVNIEGKWLGKGWGDIKENNILLKSGLRFPLTGNYKFLIQQAMRVDTLKGISDIGLYIIKEETSN